jgi:hypothetical protein
LLQVTVHNQIKGIHSSVLSPLLQAPQSSTLGCTADADADAAARQPLQWLQAPD